MENDIKEEDAIARNEGKYDSTTGPNGFGPNKPYYPNYIVDSGQ